jgi:D-ribose pyranase
VKRTGIMHAELAGRMAALGHTQTVAVADVGLPVPAQVPLVDLAVVQGLPRFADVLDALLDELVVEGHTYADEAADQASGDLLAARAERLGERLTVPHEELKTLLATCAFVVRTGEATPYANVILRCGVPF